MATSGSDSADHVLVNLNLHDNQLKEFVVDNVSALPSTVVNGKMIYYDNQLYYGKAGVWVTMGDSYKVTTDALDKDPGYLPDKVFGSYIETSTVPGTDKITRLEIKNLYHDVKAMEDVKPWNPGQTVLFGWDQTAFKFKPVYMDTSMEMFLGTDGVTLNLKRMGISEDKGWAVKGGISTGSYPGYFVHSHHEDKHLNGVSIRCGSGSCTLQVRVNGGAQTFVINTRATSGDSTTVPVTQAYTTFLMKDAKSLWHQAYIDINVLTVDTTNGCEDLSVTAWIRHT